MTVVMLLWRRQIFGDMHFLLIIPILLLFSMAVIYLASLAYPRPDAAKLQDTTFSVNDFRAEGLALRQGKLYNNYRFWGFCLLVACAVLLIVFS